VTVLYLTFSNSHFAFLECLGPSLCFPPPPLFSLHKAFYSYRSSQIPSRASWASLTLVKEPPTYFHYQPCLNPHGPLSMFFPHSAPLVPTPFPLLLPPTSSIHLSTHLASSPAFPSVHASNCFFSLSYYFTTFLLPYIAPC
jgi:hypothetical protein